MTSKIARHEEQLSLCYIYLEIAKYSRSIIDYFSFYKYFIDSVMSWFGKSCKSCLSFSLRFDGFL